MPSFESMQSAQPVERRSDLRVFHNLEVIVARTQPGQPFGFARVRNVSARGLYIEHDLPLARGDSLKVISAMWTIQMKVVWVGYINGAKISGLALENSSQPATPHAAAA